MVDFPNLHCLKPAAGTLPLKLQEKSQMLTFAHCWLSCDWAGPWLSKKVYVCNCACPNITWMCYVNAMIRRMHGSGCYQSERNRKRGHDHSAEGYDTHIFLHFPSDEYLHLQSGPDQDLSFDSKQVDHATKNQNWPFQNMEYFYISTYLAYLRKIWSPLVLSN